LLGPDSMEYAVNFKMEVLFMSKQFITADELREMLGISRGKAYDIIRKCNQELKEQGFITVAGKLPRAYFAKKYYGFDNNLVKEDGNV